MVFPVIKSITFTQRSCEAMVIISPLGFHRTQVTVSNEMINLLSNLHRRVDSEKDFTYIKAAKGLHNVRFTSVIDSDIVPIST